MLIFLRRLILMICIIVIYFAITLDCKVIYDNFPHGKLIDWNLNLLTFFPKILEIFTYVIAIFAIICTMNDKVEKMAICDKEYRKILNRLSVNIKDNRSDFESIFKLDIENFKSTYSNLQDYQYHSILLDKIYQHVIKNYDIKTLYKFLNELPKENEKYNCNKSKILLLDMSKCDGYHGIYQYNGQIYGDEYVYSLDDDVKSDKIYKLKKDFIGKYVDYLNSNTPYYRNLSLSLYNFETTIIKNTCKFINVISKMLK